MSKITAAMLLTLGAVGASSAAWAEEKTLDRTFKVSPGGRLTVDADAGHVKVTGSDGDQVVVNIVAKGSRRMTDSLTLDAAKTGAGVTVTAKLDSSDWLRWLTGRGEQHINITVAVPKRFDVEIDTAGGDVAVRQVNGDINGRTAGGDVVVDHLQGPVRMSTSGGDMNVTNVRGNVNMRTSGGDIRALSVAGDFDGSTSGGDVRAEAMTGNVKLRTSGGNVSASRITGPISAQTSGGNVRLDQIDGEIRATTSGGEVSVELVGANRGISASTSGGGIVLTLPEAVQATINASSGNGRIRSDLPVTSTIREESRLSGTINGGGERIEARTSGGNIVLRAKAADRQHTDLQPER